MDLFFHYLTMDYLLKGIFLTLEITVIGLVGGFAIGIVLAAMLLSRHRWISVVARTYTVIFRGTPLILQMVFVYDALPHMGIMLSALLAGGVALALNEAPFIAEILRSGIRGVDRGQSAAGQALGMSSFVLMRRIIAPQAIRTMIPAFGNEGVNALKNSSLASFISVQELTLRSTQLASSTFDFFSVFFASGLLYLMLTGGVSAIQLFAERALDLDRPRDKGKILKYLLPWRKDPEEALPSKPATAEGAALSELLVTPTREDRIARLAELAKGPIAVEIQDLTKSYGERQIFGDLNLQVHTGEIVALLGPSGSGKSTLLRCINRLETWNSGDVFIGGHRIGYSSGGLVLSPSEVARQRVEVGVGMLFQHFNLFAHLTAEENIAGPLRWVHGWSQEAAAQRAQELLDRVGLGDRGDTLPRHLSGGQQQRVAIARAIAPGAKVLLLDEPTSALDPEMVGEVLDVIRRLAIEEKLTMIISTHQLRFAEEVADRVIFLTDGNIVEDGPAYEVLSQPRNPLTARFIRVMSSGQTSALAL
ncbi:amino acid ABC transporter permease/ATP-binding protein [Halothiobacillus sp.]|uniref:amino acid ABC transporter permease/ATP-binding protein n=1 Tax=Halothiobacillus sp. TaxID=1891311 RepID=UPI002607C398|nr:amino acid ABC transporter permease/ATP-binding protein [Halothiobacillus sp.]